MSARIGPRFRRAPLALGLLAFALTAVGLAFEATGKDERPKPPAAKLVSAYPKPEKAKNPVTLQLQLDERQVVGWVSGPRDVAGQLVYVKLGGVAQRTIKVGRDNTFRWPYQVSKPTTAEFTLEDWTVVGPRATALLTPTPAGPGPCAFFVVDRTAYRPGQPLHFAAFLRQQDAGGEFAPLANKTVEVTLVSERKKTTAAKLKLTSDESGRLVGSYRFSDGDALDHYTLSIAGHKGGARVLLGEYRKSKVRLKIGGCAEGEKMKLTFEALDFLDKPVPITRASFVAQVVRRGKKKDYALKAEDFVHHEPQRLPLGELESLSEEDLLLSEADGVSAQTFAGLGNVPLANFNGEPKPEGSKPAVAAFDLRPEWRRGDCAVIIHGIITGADGREQRASTTIAIQPKPAEGKSPLSLNLAKQRFYTGETIEVRTDGARDGALVIMKLAFQTPSVSMVGFGTLANPHFGRLPAYRSAAARVPAIDPTIPNAETVRRTLVTAVPIKSSVAKLTLAEPGAYKLVAVAHQPDGTALQQEVSVVVKRPSEVNPLLLRLDREELKAGERLTGIIHSRFADARALLTVRDSSGIRLTKPIALQRGIYRLDEELPAGLRYGCTVDVLYPNDAEFAHGTHAAFRVVPADRMLTVNVKTPETVAPGATVNLDVDVNRREKVDLVVSVYDQSLLGIAADRAVDVRDFFLADTRAVNRLDDALLRQRLGSVRLAKLYQRAEALLKEKAKAKLHAAERQALQTLVANRNDRHLYSRDVATLMRLAGVDVYFAPIRQYTTWYNVVKADGSERLIDVIQGDRSNWRLTHRFVGNTLLLQETHPSYVSAGYQWHPVYGWDFNRGYYGGYGYRGAYGYNPYLNLQMNGLNSLQWYEQGGFGRGYGRGDAARTWNGPMLASGNSMHSFVPEGQGFISHLPAPGAPVLLLGADSDQSHISVRRDFSDSAFWNARVRTDENGRARVSVKLPDSLTNWQVVTTAVSAKMHVGQAKASFRTYKPVMVWPMLPRTFTEGDRVEVFASVHNRTDEPQTIKVRLKVENGNIHSTEEQTVQVPPRSNVPVYWTFTPGVAGFTQLLMSADCPAGSDASLKRLPVLRAAAEQVVTLSGTVRDEAVLEVPAGFDPRASRLEISFAPTLAADMADTLNYLVEYPYGCVEQTMSRFLPAIKVAQVLQKFKVQHKELEKKLPGCVSGGIKRLLDLQQADGGWGWHGTGQTHEMMTPYALYGLLQAEKAGYQIPNEAAVVRGLDRLATFINNQGDAQTADRIYCMYVFSHRRAILPQWWQWIEARLRANALSDYALALALEMAVEKEQRPLARELARKLRERAQRESGRVYWQTANFSRWGNDRFEITAAAMKALVAYDKDDPLIDGILGFFNATKRGDRWNSTKDTAMILFALCDYLARTEFDAKASRGLTVSVNGGPAHAVKFDDGLTKKVVVSGAALKAGKNTLAFRTRMSGVMYRAVFRYWDSGRSVKPMDHGIKVERKFYLLNDRYTVERELKSGDAVPRGSYVVSALTAKHNWPMRYVLVEDPRASGGETVPADDQRFVREHQQCSHHVLREDREAMTCFHLEQTPQTLTTRHVYLLELAGEYVIPPARVEMMYQTETRGHSGSFVLKVTDGKRKGK